MKSSMFYAGTPTRLAGLSYGTVHDLDGIYLIITREVIMEQNRYGRTGSCIHLQREGGKRASLRSGKYFAK
ncbi:hypothetical protein [Nitrospira sp. Nam74]